MAEGRIVPPELDDRTWAQIVEDAKHKITDCPEWTDHNPTDLGITLIELFAWIAESVIYRLNQVPEKNYIAFLNLLGITRDPLQPASVDLTFDGPVGTLIPKGTQAATEQTELEEAVVFETNEDLKLQKDESRNTVSATAALTISKPESLGWTGKLVVVSSGKPFQVFQLKNVPLYPDPKSDDPLAHLRITVNDEAWTRVEDFMEGNEPHYICNPVTGEIKFGNFPTGDPDKPGFGRIPPQGSRIMAQSYRYVVHGRRGNVAQNTVVVVKKPFKVKIGVTNEKKAEGGADWEPIEETLRRAPQEVKSRERAVTVEDYEFLAREATTEVAKVKCLPPKINPDDGSYETKPFDRPPGRVNLIIVPNVPFNPEDLDTRLPQPSTELKTEVATYLDARRVLTSELYIKEPIIYAEIYVHDSKIYVSQASDHDAMIDLIKSKLMAFFHPVDGGRDRTGWQFGQDVYLPHVYDVIQNIPNVRLVEFLALKKKDGIEPPTSIRIGIAEYEMVCSAAPEMYKIVLMNELSDT